MLIALVHDYLTQYGGAERVLEVMHGRFPDAPVFTAVFDPTALPTSLSEADVHTSWLDRLPGVRRHHQALLPFYPTAFRGFAEQLARYDVVLADSSAWAHHAGVRPDQALICYCHSPARFLHGDEDYLGASKLPGPAKHVLPAMTAGYRSGDRQAANRVDRYIANSRNVAHRIRRAYGREARVVYPPIDVDRFRPSRDQPPDDWFLVLSRLVPHKRIDLAIRACTRAGVRLRVIGDGRARRDLERLAGPTVQFVGQLDDDAVANELRCCRALILPGAEDFGMTAVEAQAAGRPVIAYGKGGALESVVDRETGLFFSEPTPSSMIDAIARFERMEWHPRAAVANAARFGTERFLRELDQEIAAALAARVRRAG